MKQKGIFLVMNTNWREDRNRATIIEQKNSFLFISLLVFVLIVLVIFVVIFLLKNIK